VPRTDLVLADPRLAEAERRLGRALVKAAVGRAQQRARDGQIAPEQVADVAVAELPARAAGLTPPAELVHIPYKSTELAAYLRVPAAPGRSAVAVLIALRIVVPTAPASIRPAHFVTGLKTSVCSTTWWVKKACRAVSI